MGALLHSKAWHWRAVRIGAPVAAALWLLSPLGAQMGAHEFPKTNFDNTIVDTDEIMSGGPPRDGIPAVDAPKFVSIADASSWLDAREPVIVVALDGSARAYPLQILMFHEIVNDELAGRPISVTFCPLCNASIVFDRRVGDDVLDFGTTGRLRKSDLVMYDRQTETWWQQLSGQGIIGDHAGTVLDRVPAQIVAFEDFAHAYGDGEVLSRETGHNRPYGRNPYRGYDSIDSRPFLFFDPIDPRLPAMERVLNISIGDVSRLYPFSRLKETPVVNDEVETTPVVVFSRDGTLSPLDGGVIAASRLISSATAFDRRLGERTLTFELADETIVDKETGSSWSLLGHALDGPLRGEKLADVPSGVHFAFAWLAFNPESEVYEQE